MQSYAPGAIQSSSSSVVCRTKRSLLSSSCMKCHQSDTKHAHFDAILISMMLKDKLMCYLHTSYIIFSTYLHFDSSKKKKKFTFQLSKCMKCLLVLSVRRIYDSASMQNSVDSTEWWWMRLLKRALLGVVRGLSFKVYDVRVSQKVQHWNQLIFILDSGSLILEMGALSRLTGDPTYEYVAIRALRKLWSMRSSLNLLGTTLDVVTGDWIEYSAGIGAGRYSRSFNSFCARFCVI